MTGRLRSAETVLKFVFLPSSSSGLDNRSYPEVRLFPNYWECDHVLFLSLFRPDQAQRCGAEEERNSRLRCPRMSGREAEAGQGT
jgi:hypothetical protein